MNARTFLLTLVMASTPQAADLARAETFESQRQALQLITDTADKICNVVSTSGEANSDEVKETVSASLNGLVSKLLGFGVSVSGATKKEKYDNVLRADLPIAMKNNTDCKIKVLVILQPGLFPHSSSVSPVPLPSPVSPVPPPCPPSIGGVWRDTNDQYNVARITQHCDQFEFTKTGMLLDRIRYKLSGSGHMSDRSHYTANYSAKYENGLVSVGQCSGLISGDGVLTSFCADTILGVFPDSLTRE